MSRRVPADAPLRFLVLLVAGWIQREQARRIDYLVAENRVLRARLGTKRLRLTDPERRVLAEKGRALGRKLLEGLSSLATPATILRWYRDLVAAKYDGSRRRAGPGRPRSKTSVASLLVGMARENPTWGYTRLRGALSNVGVELGRSTIVRLLAEHGIEPAPSRGRAMSWKTFLAAHWGAIAAADFLSVEVLTRGGLVRHLVLFVIDLKSRRVTIAGIAADPDGAWMAQVARNLTDAVDGCLKGVGHLIVDRDSLFTAQFASMLGAQGVRLLRLPARSPNLNAYAERFVRSIKSECLSKVIPLGEAHLRSVVREYVEHYHQERNHQGIGNVIPFPTGRPAIATGAVMRRERLGGMLSYYFRDAA
jgi:transposase InsO family protein